MNNYLSIYIGGTGRSGTNILKKILCEHPEAFGLPFEPRYMLDPDDIFDFYKSQTWSPYIIDFKLRRLYKLLHNLAKRDAMDQFTIFLYNVLKINKRSFTPPRYQKWELNKHIPHFTDHVEMLFNEIIEVDYPSYWCGSDSFQRNNKSFLAQPPYKNKVKEALIRFIDRNIASILEKNNASTYIDDSTFNILHAEEISELCKNARLIHIFRDPRDVVASYIQQNWVPDDLHSAINWYKSVIQEWEEIKRKLPEDFFLEIRFENLVQDFHGIIKKIETFSGIRFSEMQSTISLDKPNIGRWKNSFSHDDQQLLNDGLQEELRLLNYNT